VPARSELVQHLACRQQSRLLEFIECAAALGKISPWLLGITRPVQLRISAHDLEVMR
jgi:hypothetical protein